MSLPTQRLPAQWTSLGVGPLALQVFAGAVVYQASDRQPATDSNVGAILSATIGSTPSVLAAGSEWWIKALVAETVIGVGANAATASGPDAGPTFDPDAVAIAAIDLPAFSVVSLAADGSLQLASSADLAQAGYVLGMLPAAAQAGDAPAITRSGLLINAAWSLTRGPVWVGAGGGVTQIEPMTGFSQVLGLATAATRLLVELQPPVLP